MGLRFCVGSVKGLRVGDGRGGTGGNGSPCARPATPPRPSTSSACWWTDCLGASAGARGRTGKRMPGRALGVRGLQTSATHLQVPTPTGWPGAAAVRAPGRREKFGLHFLLNDFPTGFALRLASCAWPGAHCALERAGRSHGFCAALCAGTGRPGRSTCSSGALRLRSHGGMSEADRLVLSSRPSWTPVTTRRL